MAIDRKRLLSGGNATIAVLAVLGVLVLLNAISDKRFKRWDWTGSQIYSLSDKTVQVPLQDWIEWTAPKLDNALVSWIKRIQCGETV